METKALRPDGLSCHVCGAWASTYKDAQGRVYCTGHAASFCNIAPTDSITLYVGDQLAAFDDATVGRPRPGAPICGVVVGRDGPHVVVACRGSKLSFVVAAGLSVEGLPQIEKPRRSYCTAEEIERILPMNESLAKAGLLAGVPKDPRNIPGTLDYFMNHGCDPGALPAKVSPEAALRAIAHRMGVNLPVACRAGCARSAKPEPYIPAIDDFDLLPDAK